MNQNMRPMYKHKRTLLQFLVLSWCCIFFPCVSFSQNGPTLKLVDFLDELKATYNVDFIYNHTLLDQVVLPSSSNDCESLESCLANINEPIKATKKTA